MSDVIENLCGATVQHGPSSDRVYLMKIRDADPVELIQKIEDLAAERGYSKIFTKVPAHSAQSFLDAGYACEARVPLFFRGKEDALFLCRYLNKRRANMDDIEVLEQVMELAMTKKGFGLRHAMPEDAVIRSCREDAVIRSCREDDVGAMADIYKQVFPSYPFPVHDPAYLLETMRSHVLYFGVERKGRLLALSSAELDCDGQNAEMTDFATLPGSLGCGFAANLLAAMEPEAACHGIRTAYTIARAVSAGMNITFARLGYEFGGRLVNNTQISGTIESMNVWHKQLKPRED